MYTLVETYKEIPYTGLLWSIGTFTWLVFIMLGYAVIKGSPSCVLLCVPVIAVLLTLMIATPVHAEFRYAYSMFTTAPLIVSCMFGEKEELSK